MFVSTIFGSIRNPWGLARNESSWALPQTSWIRNSGGGAQPPVVACPACDSDMGYIGEPWARTVTKPRSEETRRKKAKQLAFETYVHHVFPPLKKQVYGENLILKEWKTYGFLF